MAALLISLRSLALYRLTQKIPCGTRSGDASVIKAPSTQPALPYCHIYCQPHVSGHQLPASCRCLWLEQSWFHQMF